MKRIVCTVLALAMLLTWSRRALLPPRQRENHRLHPGGPELWQQSQADAAKYAAEKLGYKFIA